MKENFDSNLDTVASLDAELERHYAGVSPAALDELRRAFAATGYVKIPSFTPPAVTRAVRAEAHALFERLAVRRNVRMRVTGNTPRILSNVRCADIRRDGQLIPAFYAAPALKRFVAAVFGEACHDTPYENERYMILSLRAAGDTHGWHWDDYAFSLIWLIEAPPKEKGGWVEFVPRTRWDKDDPDTVARVLREREVERRDHVRDDVYLLRGDTCMHRVAPLTGDAFRLVLNLAWASAEDLDKPVSHETLDELYG